MKNYQKIIFVGQTGACREAMAEAIIHDFTIKQPIEIIARGLVVLFPEPMNQKAEAVLISNGLSPEDFSSVQLSEEDLTENTLILTIEKAHRERVLEQFPQVSEEDIYALNEFVGDELEILDPYGGALAAYGLCYESIRRSIKKLVRILNETEDQTE